MAALAVLLKDRGCAVSGCDLSRSARTTVPITPAIDPGVSPMLLEIMAVTGEIPHASSAGKVNSVPEPTSVLMAPAPAPAAKTTHASHAFTDAPEPVCEPSRIPCSL